MKKLFALMVIFSLTAMLVVTGCNGTPEKKDPTQESTNEWWLAPGNIQLQGYIGAFVGSAKIHGDKSFALENAQDMARRAVAAFLKAEVQSLSELWQKEAGDALKKESVSSFFNNERFTRVFIDQAVKGAVYLQTHEDKQDKIMYVLMGVRSNDYLDKFAADVGSNLDTMLVTDVMKGQARNALDKMIAEKKKDNEKAAKFVLNGEGTGAKVSTK